MKLTWQTEKRRVRDLLPAEYNPRQMTEDQARELRKSLEKFDLVEIPAIDQNGTILAGHMRVATLIDLGRGDETIDVRVPNRKLTDEEAMEYNLRSNKNTGEWDLAKLFAMPEGLLEEVGFSNKEIQKLVDGNTTVEEDDYETDKGLELPVRVARGEIWQLGSHRIMCGDSTSKEDVERLMDGKKADLTFTSPPYNANTKVGEGSIFNGKASKKLYADGYSDNLDSSDYVSFASCILEICFSFTDGFIFWNVSYNANSRFEYIKQIVNRLPNLIEQICWKKSSTIPFKGSLRRDWEPIFLFSTNGEKLGLETVVSNHWEVNNTNSQQKDHKACFPIELPARGINLIKSKTGIVFDPFGGSGSTLIACEQTKRVCYMMEIDPKYCTVILDRWEKHTGQKAAKIV